MMGTNTVQNVNQKSHLNLATKNVNQFTLCVMKLRHRNFLILVVAVVPLSVLAKTPDCAGVDRWPTKMAFTHLKNAGITNIEKVDFSKTKTVRLASEKRGKDLYRQIHQVTFIEKSGSIIQVVTSNDVSSEECSMSAVDVFVVSQVIKGSQ